MGSDRAVFKKFFKVAAFSTPCVWSACLVWMTNLISLRIAYTGLWHQHLDLMTSGHERSPSGDTLSELFEYMSTAQTEYVNALELVVLFGLAPALATYLLAAADGLWRSPSRFDFGG